MKKIILFLLFTTFVQAQFSDHPKHEVKFNILNTLAIASVEIGYEHFLAEQQTIEAELLINDRFSYHSEKGSREFKTNSVKIGYNYYFDSSKSGAGIYANPFMKYRFGDFNQTVSFSGTDVDTKLDISSFILGIGVGYKINAGDKFSFAPYVNIARNFNSDVEKRFSAIEANAGISIGFRF
jgi:hypothetical protein